MSPNTTIERLFYNIKIIENKLIFFFNFIEEQYFQVSLGFWVYS